MPLPQGKRVEVALAAARNGRRQSYGLPSQTLIGDCRYSRERQLAAVPNSSLTGCVTPSTMAPNPFGDRRIGSKVAQRLALAFIRSGSVSTKRQMFLLSAQNGYDALSVPYV